MAIKKKRKGKFFVTEHYLDEETKKACNDVLVKAFIHLSGKDEHNANMLFKNEVSFWGDPSALELYFGHSSSLSDKIPWDELGVGDEEFSRMMVGLRNVYDEHGPADDTSRTFKVIFNDEQVETIRNMVNL